MKLVKISLAVIIASNLSFAFTLGDITKIATDSLNKSDNTSTKPVNANSSNEMISSGLKEALNQGVQSAINTLGKDNGYLNNDNVTISLPENLSVAETLIRKSGAGDYADDLLKAINTAASSAAVKTAPVFLDSIEKMTIEDSNKILKGSNTAATDYFKKKTSQQLKSLIAPIVKQSIASNDVAKYYDAFNSAYKTYGKDLVQNNNVMSYAKSFGVENYIPGNDEKSLDEYITAKTIDGIFTMIAQEEMAIRENPLNRSTDLLKKVFK